MFIAYAKQEGEGCDYTIGCGQILWKLKAQSYEEAIEELKSTVIGKWLPEFCEYEEGYWEDFKLESVTLYEVNKKEEVPINKWYSDALMKIKQEKNKVNEEYEKIEFERLKAKFG